MGRRLTRRVGISFLVAVGLLGAPSLAAPGDESATAAKVTVVAEGLKSPRGIALAHHALYVAEAGKGGAGPCVAHPVLGGACIGRWGSVARVKGNDLKRVVRGLPSIAGPIGEAFGPHDVWVAGDGEVYVTIGLVGTPALRAKFGSKGTRLGHLLRGRLRRLEGLGRRPRRIRGRGQPR
jgi:hypothetical protein